MHLSDLITPIREMGVRDSDTLIAIPFYKEYDALPAQLGYLNAQTYKDFNVLLVLSSVTDEKRIARIIEKAACGFGVILVKRKAESGSAGGFYTCQKYALEKGLPYVILADSDCFPVDPSMIEMLVKNRDKGYVCPVINYTGGDKTAPLSGRSISNYGLISRGMMLRYGLYFAPIYGGAEDIEYMERIGEKPFVIANAGVHPFFGGSRMFENPAKYWRYLLQGAMFASKPYSYIVNLAVSIPAMTIFSPSYGRTFSARLLGLFLTCTYDKRVADSFGDGFAGAMMVDSIPQSERFETIDSSSKPASILPKLRSMFRKNVEVVNTHAAFSTITLGSMVARKLYLRLSNGKYLLVSDNGSLPVHLIKIAAFSIVVLPFAVFMILALVALRLLEKPRTMGYGL